MAADKDQGGTMKITQKVLKPILAPIRRSATEATKNGERAADLLAKVKEWLSENGSSLGDLRREFVTLTRLARAWHKGTYTKVPKATIVKVLVAIIYVVLPVDLIPDAIPFVGFVDDIAVVKLVLNSISNDVEEFRTWERAQKVRAGRGRKLTASKRGKPSSKAMTSPKKAAKKK